MDPQFITSLISSFVTLPYYILAITLAWYIPGSLTLGKTFIKKSHIEKITLALIVGMAMWALQGVLLGYMQLRVLTYLYIFIFLIIWFKKFRSVKNRKISIPKITHLLKENKLLLIIFILGIFGQLQQFIISGFTFSRGIYMLTGSSDDAFWHTALINQLVHNFPPIQPGLSGVVVHNYHYLSNLIVADIIRIFHLPLMPTQYIYIYTTVAALIGLVAFTLGRSLNLSKFGVITIVYLQYFSSDIIYIISYFSKSVFEFTVHPLEDGTMFLENPPRAFASIFALAVVALLIEFQKKKTLHIGLILSLVSGLIIGLKVHHGFLVLSGLFSLSIYFIYTRQFKLLIYPLISAFLSLSIYLPVNVGAGAPVFVLFDMARMFVGQDRLGLSHFELARQIYEQHGNTLQIWRMYLIMFMLFILAEFGIKNIGFIPVKYTIQKLGTPLYICLYSGILSALVIGTFFIQPVAGADIFNFFLSASLYLGILASINIDRWSQNKNKMFISIFVIFILLCTLPRWIYKTSTVKFYSQLSSPVISTSELKAMEYIKENTPSNTQVLVFNSGQWDSMYPYVSAFTNRSMYLSGQVILGRHGVSIKSREAKVKELMNLKNTKEFYNELKKNKITHLYFYGDPLSILKIDSMPGEKIFYNNVISVYKL